MIGMDIVAAALAIMIWWMLVYDSRERKRLSEKHDAKIAGMLEGTDTRSNETTPGIERELKLLREDLTRLERRLFLKITMICVLAIQVAAIVVLYCR